MSQCPPPSIYFSSDKPKDEDAGIDEKNLSDKEGEIAAKTGLTREEVEKRIHEAKKNLPKSGPTRNPNVAVDTKTGKIYPKIPGGGYGDDIGGDKGTHDVT